MNTLTPTADINFPLQWADLEDYRNSKAQMVEIYLRKTGFSVQDLVSMFNHLFTEVMDDMKVYSPLWWDFCLDTWNVQKDVYDYGFEGKSKESTAYLHLLKSSNIELGYEGCCSCANWPAFLNATLPCILNHSAPYGHILYSEKYSFFFYFHHTGSIGFYYETETPLIGRILVMAKAEYDVMC